jgi:hypothetical protein
MKPPKTPRGQVPDNPCFGRSTFCPPTEDILECLAGRELDQVAAQFGLRREVSDRWAHNDYRQPIFAAHETDDRLRERLRGEYARYYRHLVSSERFEAADTQRVRSRWEILMAPDTI